MLHLLTMRRALTDFLVELKGFIFIELCGKLSTIGLGHTGLSFKGIFGQVARLAWPLKFVFHSKGGLDSSRPCLFAIVNII